MNTNYSNSETPTIHIGLCLAGAISAGAYTAGVIDYLFETLERWEIAKKNHPDDPCIPRHKVVIEVITGASAGGIAGGFLILQNNKKFNILTKEGIQVDPIWFTKNINMGGSIQYDAWVNMIDGDEGKDMMEHLLHTTDIDTGDVESILNSTFFDKLTSKFISNTSYNSTENKEYISADLEFATSVSNVDGIASKIKFNNTNILTNLSQQSPNNYLTVSAKDFAHFQIVNSDKINPLNGQIPLKVDANSINTDIFGQALMATSAFPIGFKPRILKRDGSYIIKNPLLSNAGLATNIKEGESYDSLNVDGGMVNNEPFEVSAYLLQRRIKPNTTNRHNFNEVVESFSNENRLSNNPTCFSTILMVDPFPTESEKKVQNEKKKINVIESAIKILIALRRQPLVKVTDIQAAIDGNDYSRFMLAPRRKIIDVNGGVKIINGSDAIACGLLGGFGGFLDRKIREHDYLLGRFNCQHFLQKRFGMDIKEINRNANNIFNRSFTKDENLQYLINKETNIFPFIPDLDITNGKITLNPLNGYQNHNPGNTAPTYPAYPQFKRKLLKSKLNKWKSPIRERVKLILTTLVSKYSSLLTANIVAFYYTRKIVKQTEKVIIKGFESHGLFKD